MDTHDQFNVASGFGFDNPVVDPADDLLDMARQAEVLAKYIQSYLDQLPFTVGIFGEWGEGKTTLVRFLKHYLFAASLPAARPTFIYFSAWPYTTSDELWRALIVKIARRLYEVPDPDAAADAVWDDADPPLPPPAVTQGASISPGHQPRSSRRAARFLLPWRRQQTDTPAKAISAADSASDPRPARGLVGKLEKFFTGDAIVLRPTQPGPFADLLSRLQQTSIARRGSQAQFDQDAALNAIVGAAMAALSAASPAFGALRGVLNVDKVDLSKIVQSRSPELSQDTLDSLPKFRQEFNRMVENPRVRKPIYVFIDDLDRCQPNVALDILEAIRISLAEAKCIFIVAVDDRLIGQGLRMRYGDRPNGQALKLQYGELMINTTEDDDLERKGQEYIEKIIQFGIRLPPTSRQQCERFVAAQFPHWMAAADIVETVCGNNPRRVKKYCHRLTFQRMIGKPMFSLGALQRPHAPPNNGVAPQPIAPQPNVPQPNVRPLTLEQRNMLEQLLTQFFDESEARELGSQLDIPYDSFAGATRVERTHALAAYAEERDRLADLLAAMIQRRPDASPIREFSATLR
jgi:hypothetical protein